MYAPPEKNNTSNNTATVASPVTGSFFKPAPQTAPPVPDRGPNPATCFKCDTLAHPTPTCLKDPKQCAEDFKTTTMACLTANAPASNAAYFSDILANTASEIDDQIAYMNAHTPKLDTAKEKSEYIDWLHSFCERKQREVWLEFNYNLVFENVQGQSQWVYSKDQWDAIENSLRAIPDEDLWGRKPPLPATHFRRETTGPPSPTGKGKVGGDTDPLTGQIRVFDAGVGTAPYSRSPNLGMSATDQTIRHEVGHLVDATVSQKSKDEFFDKVVQWTQYSMAWITAPRPMVYPTWQAERDRACTELNFMGKDGKCDDAKMDGFLASLGTAPATVNGRLYSKDGNFLVSWPVSNVPSGPEFEYARTNKGEYFAELYAFAISAPAFFIKSLPANQVEWFKANVFHTEAHYQAIIAPYKQLAINASPSAQYQALIGSARDLFTEQQLRSVARQLDALLTQMSIPQPNA